MGGSVKIRQLEDGSYVLSPNPKRRRTDIDEEEGSKGAEISAEFLEVKIKSTQRIQRAKK